MNDAAAVGIVEIEAVNEDAIEKRGVARRYAYRHSDHRGLTRSCESADRSHSTMRKVIGGRSERNSDGVENKMFSASGDGAGDLIGWESADKARQLFGDQRCHRSLGMRSFENGDRRHELLLRRSFLIIQVCCTSAC